MTKCSFCDGEAESTHFDLPACKKHSLEFRLFKEKKIEMRVGLDDDMRVVERMMRLNPGIVKCPCCEGALVVHHWKASSEGRVPFFKCPACEFLG